MPTSDRTIVREDRKGLRFPAPPRDLASALRWSSWITCQVARGNLTAPEATAMLAGLKEFRALLDARDADAKLVEAKRILEEMKALKGRP